MDRELFAAAVIEHGNAMFRAARACTSTDVDAEDAAAEAVLRAWKSAGTLCDATAMRGWLIKIAVNCAREAHRKSGRETPTEDLEALGGAAEMALPSALWEMVCILPEEQRAAVTLFYFEDMKESEIAKALGVPLGTVKSRLSRAREKLRTMLEKEG